MKLFFLPWNKRQNRREKRIRLDYQYEAILEQGKEQLQRLVQRGLRIPVAMS